ncbi:MAG: hypothetical protein QUS11_07635 [Candidatus Fermentibacter sp.]|nr:hypothetical protein [Candidatus Fermentibacter sp.]
MVLALILAAAATAAPDGIALDHPVYIPSVDYVIDYDDGTAYWLTWTTTYHGVWFHPSDFGYSGWDPDASEMWFYHHSYYPWDTGSFYCELCTGGASGPEMALDQESLTAVHYAPCYAYHDIGVPLTDFWIVVNTSMSSGGWPSILGDPDPSSPAHSFQSDDFATWDAWDLGDFFIRSHYFYGLESETWGAIKALYPE